MPGIVINVVCANKKVRQTKTDGDGGLSGRRNRLSKRQEEREKPKNDGQTRQAQTVTSPLSRSSQIKMHGMLRWTVEAGGEHLSVIIFINTQP